VVTIRAARLLVLPCPRGSVELLVVMYAIHVYPTRTLPPLGMMRHAEHVPGEAANVKARQRQAGRGGSAELEGHVLLRVGQAGEGDDRGRG